MDIFIAIISAIFGAIVSLGLYIAYESANNIRTKIDIFGTWYSTWKPTGTQDWDWVEEQMTVQSKWGKIKFISYGNSKGYDWVSNVNIIRNQYFLGDWKSTLPGSPAEGVFMLTFSFDGKCLIGYIISRDMENPKLATPFVMARKKEYLDIGKNRLRSTPINFE